ncbi:MAG: hypothetical protein IJL96_09535, partial [Clostridia bacterium]|nr:hypothetical protein [Clostridia bacterium]
MRRNAKKSAAMRKFLAMLLTAVLLLPTYPAPADGNELPPQEEDPFQGSAGLHADMEGAGFPMLTEEQFAVDDLPDQYLEEAVQAGRVEKVRYIVSDENKEVKSVTVYLPVGYDEGDAQYNVLYILHAASGSTKNYLDPDRKTPFQCLLDNMIADGKLNPLIVVAATYYPTEGFT